MRHEERRLHPRPGIAQDMKLPGLASSARATVRALVEQGEPS